jgi:hypothetical protein
MAASSDPTVLLRHSLLKHSVDGRSYAIDLVDFEMVPAPLRRPSASLSVVDFGADPNGELDSREAFSKAIAAASSSGRPVWVPPGHFRLDGHVQVDHVEIAGAGGRQTGASVSPARTTSSSAT